MLTKEAEASITTRKMPENNQHQHLAFVVGFVAQEPLKISAPIRYHRDSKRRKVISNSV
jgi:hypothetical protein